MLFLLLQAATSENVPLVEELLKHRNALTAEMGVVSFNRKE